ncbi:MAG: addiction module protein [Bacteroidetes bacterium]|nr:addiction module protein [Bacteroidota bacterium]
MLTKAELDRMSVDERIELAWALWDSIETDPQFAKLTNAQQQELARRLEASMNTDKPRRPWREVIDEIEARLGNVPVTH